MVSVSEAFIAASNLDFETIHIYVTEGGNINAPNEKWETLLKIIIERYLAIAEKTYTEEEKLTIDTLQKDTEEFWNSFLCLELTKPLSDRAINIERELDFLFDHSADPNGGLMVNGVKETPLMASVCHLDFYLSEYLLSKNADPGLRLFDDSSISIEKDYWLMDEMDIQIMNGAKGQRAKAILKITGLLYQHGMMNWNGYCIKIDGTNNKVSCHPLQTIF